jgi:hypothetical protein
MILKFRNFKQLQTYNENQGSVRGSLIVEGFNVNPDNPKQVEAAKDVDRCITKVIGMYPFYGEFVQHARILFDHPAIDTMATDGKNIFVSSEFVSNLKDKETIFVLCHEILHIVLLHHFRMDEINADPNKWNYAADYEINPYLIGQGLLSVDELANLGGGKYPGLYKEEYKDLDAETIYAKIPNPPQPEEDDDEDFPKPPDVEPEIGDFVRVKSDNSFGKITGKNPDGSWKIEPATEEEIDAAFGSGGGDYTHRGYTPMGR